MTTVHACPCYEQDQLQTFTGFNKQASTNPKSHKDLSIIEYIAVERVARKKHAQQTVHFKFSLAQH